MNDLFKNLIQSLNDALTGFGIHMEYQETTADEREFYEVLMLCYELLARTSLMRAVQVPVDEDYIDDGDDLQPGDLVPAYTTTCDALADMAFALTTNKGKVDLRALLDQIIYRHGNTVMVQELTGFHKTNLSDYRNGKREMNTGTYTEIMNALIAHAHAKAQ